MKKISHKNLPKFDDVLREELKDPAVSCLYLTEALKADNYSYFYECIRDVIKANGGFTEVAKKLKVSRTSLYKTLSADKKASFLHIHRILKYLNIEIDFHLYPKKKIRKAA